jgi:hypothetical protein
VWALGIGPEEAMPDEISVAGEQWPDIDLNKFRWSHSRFQAVVKSLHHCYIRVQHHRHSA